MSKTKQILTANENSWKKLVKEFFPGADMGQWEKMRKNYTGKYSTRKGRTSNASKARRSFNYAADMVRQDATRRI